MHLDVHFEETEKEFCDRLIRILKYLRSNDSMRMYLCISNVPPKWVENMRRNPYIHEFWCGKFYSKEQLLFAPIDPNGFSGIYGINDSIAEQSVLEDIFLTTFAVRKYIVITDEEDFPTAIKEFWIRNFQVPFFPHEIFERFLQASNCAVIKFNEGIEPDFESDTWVQSNSEKLIPLFTTDN